MYRSIINSHQDKYSKSVSSAWLNFFFHREKKKEVSIVQKVPGLKRSEHVDFVVTNKPPTISYFGECLKTNQGESRR